nr:hypothetical protein GCM10020093_088710 [Planobispora longispora]
MIWTGTLAGETAGETTDAATGETAGGAGRRATMLPSGVTMAAGPVELRAGAGPVCRYLYEPDGAAIRAHLVAEVAALVGGHLLDPNIAYITSEAPAETPGPPATRCTRCCRSPSKGSGPRCGNATPEM